MIVKRVSSKKYASFKARTTTTLHQDTPIFPSRIFCYTPLQAYAASHTTTVSTYAQFTAAAKGDSKKVIVISKPISTSAAAVRPGSNTSIVGKDSSVKLTGFGILVKDVQNVIIRNIAVSKIVESNGDALAVHKGTNVWIDHVDVSSDMSHGKDYYGGLIDLTHATDFNKAEDTGKRRVTFHGNYWNNINSRGPSIRFGTAHFFNNFYNAVSDGINTRLGAQVPVESNVVVGGKKALYSTDAGYAVESRNEFGGAKNEAL
ncbi:polysaccharide lyase family 1 protein [Cadophora sp. DSE1049]|nr:polysaccharide lyase family 1 protein [Cadophora sp. DSE1049]